MAKQMVVSVKYKLMSSGLCLLLSTLMRGCLLFLKQLLGRYDNLVGMFSGKQVPAVGVSLGIERIFAILEAKHRQEAAASGGRIRETKTQVSFQGSSSQHLQECAHVYCVTMYRPCPTGTCFSCHVLTDVSNCYHSQCNFFLGSAYAESLKLSLCRFL